MKKHIHYLLFILLSLCLFACSSNELYENERIEDSDEIKKVTIIMPQLDIDESHSRTAFTMGEWPNIKLEWAEKDTLGIYPNEGDQLSFPIVGSGTSCTFNGGGWALKSSYSYTAYFPFNRAYYYEDKKSLPITMLGQKQTGNNNSKHLSAYDILIAIGEKPESGSLTFTPERKCAFARMDLVAPCAATWKSITLKSNAAFTTKAIMDLSLVIPTITATAQSNSVTLDLENVQTTADNLNIIAYMMFLPVDFTGKTLSIELKDSDDNIYTSNAVITNNKTNFAANGARWISAVFEKKSDTNEIPYVTFKADEQQFFYMSKTVNTLEYSVGGDDWNTLGISTIIFGGDNGDLRLRGKCEAGTATHNTSYSKISFGNASAVSCSGDIRTLLDYENYTTVYTGYAKFCYLFDGCYQLTSSPNLPATTLDGDCYMSMFRGCTSLIEAPALPATILNSGCYDSMFSGCTSLTEAPVLPATTLAMECYDSMFSGCTSLAEAPALPATNLKAGCYYKMFSGCTALTKAPALPATTGMPNYCYAFMFSDCTSLTKAPALPSTSLWSYCYTSMFSGCTSLIEAPALPATTLYSYCYESMFSGCTSLAEAPVLPATTLVGNCYNCYDSMFSGCTNLNKVTMLATNIDADACLRNWLKDVSSTGIFIKAKEITSLPEGASGIPTGWTVVDYAGE